MSWLKKLYSVTLAWQSDRSHWHRHPCGLFKGLFTYEARHHVIDPTWRQLHVRGYNIHTSWYNTQPANAVQSFMPGPSKVRCRSPRGTLQLPESPCLSMRHAAGRGEMTWLELTVNRRCAKLHLFLAKSRWAVYANFMAMHQVLGVNTALECPCFLCTQTLRWGLVLNPSQNSGEWARMRLKCVDRL